MTAFGQYPFIRILLPFLTGILSNIYFGLGGSFSLFLFIFLFIIYLTDFITVNVFGKFSLRVFNGAYIFFLLFLAGTCWPGFFEDRKDPDHFIHLEEKERTFHLEIVSEPVMREKTVKAEVSLSGFYESEDFHSTRGMAIIYFRKDEKSEGLKYGDELIVHTRLQKIPPPQNPGEFDYRNYLNFHRIYAQGFTDGMGWKKIGEKGNAIKRFAIELRQKLLSILSGAGLENQEYAVASALVLGYTNEIDQETKMAYSSSGALHVLSVSGLHVAIIFAVFDKLLLFLLLFRNGKYHKAFLILIILWLYALLTGLSPSVIRSAAMLSFVVIGKLINRNASIYNILSASAFVLLCFDPLMIMEVGFQLSYLAVLGIVYLHPKIYHLFFFRNKLADFIWNVTAVSVAAQIATFPLGLLYFHQFPNYFLISNLIVIPLGTVILYNGILALIFSFVPGLNDFLVFTLKWSVKILNESVHWVEQLPYSLSKGISISIFETWLIYLILITFFLFTDFKRTVLLKLSISSCILLFTVFSFEKWNQNCQSEFVVHHIREESAFELINGRKNLFISENELKSDENKMLFHIRNHWDESGIVETEYSGLFEKSNTNDFFSYKNYYSLNGLRIAVVNSEVKSFCPEKKLEVDVVLIAGQPKIELAEIREMYDFGMLVIDPTNGFYSVKKWKQEKLADEMMHVVSEQGAFVIGT